ncbi:hypothetical protein ZWY2020_037844 [Hordeum vulgare]|nr:hypothetical protein ZWY2020_037844 [Hordeum vulgare]
MSTQAAAGLRVYQDTNMSGIIPDAIANLTFLETLTLHHLPAISGAIPDSLVALSNLSELTISYIGVSARPSFLGALTALTLLDLSYNSLWRHPAVPRRPHQPLQRSTSVRTASPAIPSPSYPSPRGAYLQLSHNNLSASSRPSSPSQLLHADLSRNTLSGDATCLFGAEKAIQHLDVSRNALNFDLSDVEFPEQLTYADLSHNAIRGAIPAQVATLDGLQQFNVSFNRLCGAVPTGGNMSRFGRYSYLHNKCLCGTPLTACRQRPVGYLH